MLSLLLWKNKELLLLRKPLPMPNKLKLKPKSKEKLTKEMLLLLNKRLLDRRSLMS
jgi:hypothetical protein